jgi:hypothetical protein
MVCIASVAAAAAADMQCGGPRGRWRVLQHARTSGRPGALKTAAALNTIR